MILVSQLLPLNKRPKMSFLLILFISFIAINCSKTSYNDEDLDERKSLLDRLRQLLPIPSLKDKVQDLFDVLQSIISSTIKGFLQASLPTFIYDSFYNIYYDHFKSIDSIIREMGKRLIAMEKDQKADVKNRQTEINYLKVQLTDLKGQLNDVKAQLANMEAQLTDAKAQSADTKAQLNKMETIMSEIRDNNNLWSLIYQALIMMVYFFISIITVLTICLTTILWIWRHFN